MESRSTRSKPKAMLNKSFDVIPVQTAIQILQRKLLPLLLHSSVNSVCSVFQLHSSE
jgi:hypothetical protein